jgi:hypothetical protein
LHAGPVIRQLYDDIEREEDPLKAFIADTWEPSWWRKPRTRYKLTGSRGLPQGWLITNRYSPGYCGWHVSEQQKL